MKNLLILVSLIALFSGCNSNVQKSIDNKNELNRQVQNSKDQKMNRLQATIIKNSAYIQDQDELLHGKKENLIFYSDNQKDIEAFKKEYKRLTGEDAPSFDGVMVVSKMGTHNTGGYGIELDEISEDSRYIKLNLRFSSPKKGMIVTQVITNPYIIINIPKTHKSIKIIEK
jgi:hypothetical protein